jgi:hypothetical protein
MLHACSLCKAAAAFCPTMAQVCTASPSKRGVAGWRELLGMSACALQHTPAGRCPAYIAHHPVHQSPGLLPPAQAPTAAVYLLDTVLVPDVAGTRTRPPRTAKPAGASANTTTAQAPGNTTTAQPAAGSPDVGSSSSSSGGGGLSGLSMDALSSSLAALDAGAAAAPPPSGPSPSSPDTPGDPSTTTSTSTAATSTATGSSPTTVALTQSSQASSSAALTTSQANAPTSGSGSGSNRAGIIAGAAVGSVALVALVAAGVMALRSRSAAHSYGKGLEPRADHV